VTEGDIVISPIPAPTFTLEQLLAGITDENLHEEIATGPAVGNEAARESSDASARSKKEVDAR
jgi:antitoxin component of MazEF toxin-antitoxin module